MSQTFVRLCVPSPLLCHLPLMQVFKSSMLWDCGCSFSIFTSVTLLLSVFSIRISCLSHFCIESLQFQWKGTPHQLHSPPQTNCLLIEFGWMRATCRYPSNVSVIETLALQKLAGVKDIWEKYPSPHPLFWTLPPSPSPSVLVTLHDKYLPYVNQKHLIFARVYFFSVLPNTYSWRCFQVYGNPSFTLRTSIKYDRSDRGLTQSLCFVLSFVGKGMRVFSQVVEGAIES